MFVACCFDLFKRNEELDKEEKPIQSGALGGKVEKQGEGVVSRSGCPDSVSAADFIICCLGQCHAAGTAVQA